MEERGYFGSRPSWWPALLYTLAVGEGCGYWTSAIHQRQSAQGCIAGKRRLWGKKILSKFLGSSAWEMTGLSVRPVRQDFAGGVIKTSTHVSSLQLKAQRGWISWGQCRIQESLWYRRHCFICLKTVGRAWKLLPPRGLQSRDQTSQLSFPRIGMLLPQYTKEKKRTKGHKSLPKPMRTQHSISNS